MSGVIESVLSKRYGQPSLVATSSFKEYRWNDGQPGKRCTLYKSLTTSPVEATALEGLEAIYGDFLGGSLIGPPCCLKIAMLGGPRVFGLYSLRDLLDQPEVQDAISIDPAISWFMDASNVWYYGVKGNELFVYDAETEELYSLGDTRSGLEQLLVEWEVATREH